MKLLKTWISIGLGGVIIGLGFFLSSIPQPASAAVSAWQKGASIVPYSTTVFGDESFRQSVRNLQSTGANYVTLIIPYYQSSRTSSDIQPGWNTPTDASLVSATDYIHSLGMHVMYKIHAETFDGQWRAYIDASDRNAWFTAYGNVLNHYGQIGQQHGVEEMCIGAELIGMSTPWHDQTNTAHWKTLIANLRSIYQGKLTYSANWDGNEKETIGFWSDLDYIGVSAYFELHTDTSVQSLVNAWGGVSSQVSSLNQQYGKPVLFTEVGYVSAQNAQNQPWNPYPSGTPDQGVQSNLYQALFTYWNNQSYMIGVHLWDWSTDPNAGNPNEISYTPQHKQAQQVMTQWFNGGGSTPPPPPPASCSGTGTNAFVGCYFGSQNFTNLKLTRTDSAINFDWGNGSPDPAMPADNFSVLWQGNFNFDAAGYTFTARADDGIRVSVDGTPLIDKFIDQPPTTYTASKTMTAGSHAVKVEYYENGGGAVAQVNWTKNGGSTPPPPPPGGSCGAAGTNAFTGCYYKDQTFGTFGISRTDSTINFDWGNGSPDPAIPNDHFSTRWQGNFSFDAASYQFSATADDGIRVLVDGTPVIDKFIDQPATTYTATKTMTSGSHAVTVEYYENGGGAVAKVNWTKQGGSTPPPPPPPTAGVVEVWWPSDGVAIMGAQPFKAVLQNTSLTSYNMYWQVDGDVLNLMYDSQQDAPHKEAWVDVSGWNWKGSGPYTITFIAKNSSGTELARKSVTVTVNH